VKYTKRDRGEKGKIKDNRIDALSEIGKNTRLQFLSLKKIQEGYQPSGPMKPEGQKHKGR